MKRKRRIKPDEKLPMTPMIDIVFQLLVYFVFTYQIVDSDTQFTVQAPGPSSEVAEPLETLQIQILEGNNLMLNLVPLSLDQLAVVLQEASEFDTEGLITLRSAPDAEHRQLVEVLNLCQKFGFLNIAILR